MKSALLMLFFAALVAGCGGVRALVPGQSAEADVRAAMGAPRETRTEGGDQVWEYPTGPEGFTNYSVRFGADGKVKSVTQLVSEEQLEKIVVGKSTRDDVRRILGRPAEEKVYHFGPTWYWRFLRNGVSTGYLIVTFDSASIATSKIAIQDAYPGAKF
jgi:SmpA/OmlA family protein